MLGGFVMAKNSIGQFIAALRKANGMTQQEVAERLNVSNKAVSRWERDECAPDLSLIPAIAEMFGVTCDELLKGERIFDSSSQEKKEPRVEKQLKNLINRTLSGFKTLIYISITASAAGLVCMFGISYGFYRPVIGFAVMLLFEICALVLGVLAVNRAKEVRTDNELFEEADDALIDGFDNTLGSFSFITFFATVSVVLLSLPLVIITSDYVESVVPITTYFTFFFVGIAMILAIVFLKCRKPYMEWISGNRKPKEPRTQVSRRVGIMSAAQIVLTVLAGLSLAVAPFFEKNNADAFTAADIGAAAGLGCIFASIICFVLFLLKNKEGRKKFILPGIRNLFFIPSVLIIDRLHYAGFYSDENDVLQRQDIWQPECIFYAVALALFVFVLFSLIDALIKRKSR